MALHTILQVRNLHVEYRARQETRHALRAVNFDVYAGEIVGVLGESGSGKSTLAASLLRMLPCRGAASRGQILFNGLEVTQMTPSELLRMRGKQIAMIPQEPALALHPVMRVRDQVAEILRAHESLNRKELRARTLEAFGQVFANDFERIAQSYPHELSGGQRQRVMVAQAIACRPQLIVADEPTAALDSVTQQEILALFLQLRQQLGVAFIFITHNPAALLDFADRVMVLYAGRLVECGRTEDVFFAPQHPYTQALLKCFPRPASERAPSIKEALPVIPGAAPDLSRVPPGCIFEPRCALRMPVCQCQDPVTEILPPRHEVACLKFAS